MTDEEVMKMRESLEEMKKVLLIASEILVDKYYKDIEELQKFSQELDIPNSIKIDDDNYVITVYIKHSGINAIDIRNKYIDYVLPFDSVPHPIKQLTYLEIAEKIIPIWINEMKKKIKEKLNIIEKFIKDRDLIAETMKYKMNKESD